MIDILRIAKQTEVDAEGRTWFEVKPAELYPATIAHMRGVVETGQAPQGALRQEYDKAVTFNADDWALAEMAFADVTPEIRARREVVLETARRWFTEMLHQIAGGSIGLHILKDERFRL